MTRVTARDLTGFDKKRKRLAVRFSLLSVGLFILVMCAVFAVVRNEADRMRAEWIKEQELIQRLSASLNERAVRIVDGSARESLLIGPASLEIERQERQWHKVLVSDEHLCRVVALRIEPSVFDTSSVALPIDELLRDATTLHYVQAVKINSNEVTSAGMRAIGSFHCLTRLHLANAVVTDADIAMILCHCPLETLTLDNVPVTGDFLLVAADRKSLKSLSVTSQELRPDRLERFQLVRPDVQFRHGAFTLGTHR